MEKAGNDDDDDAMMVVDTFVNDLLVNPQKTAEQLLLLNDNKSNSDSTTLVHTLHQACRVYHAQMQDLSQQLASSLQQPPQQPVQQPAQKLLLMDAETIWGQVELLFNNNHTIVLDRSTKQLKATQNEIRVLDVVESDADDNEEEDEEDSSSEEGEDEEVDDEDEDAKRLQSRMDRALQDMNDDDDESMESEEDHGDTASTVDPDEFARDQEAVNLHDGFFNLQEMEAFADEEEDYLPVTTTATTKKQKKKSNDTRSFHQKQRDGELESLESSDDDDNDNKAPVRRKYRKSNEVDLLFKIYDDEKQAEEDDEILQMTAADLFGKPNPKYLNRWEKNHRGKDDGDDDSWNDYDFTKNKGGQEKEWRDTGNDEEEEAEEMVPMKPGKDSNDSQKASKPPTRQAAILLQQTEQLEQELLAEKPWQMKGETGATSRPVNSLLESTPEFAVTAKVAPVITAEFTETLEQMIEKRILAEDWDDVVPRELPDVGWNQKRGEEAPEVSQEKSKLSLGELYEREYLKKTVGYDVDKVEKQTEEEKAKDEMRSLFANLCSKLDALSNYHFTPRPIAMEAEIRQVSRPAIAMEEVLPLHVSDTMAVAPEEVYGAKRGRSAILREDSELEKRDRKRLRNAKKSARRKARQAHLADEKLVSRLSPGNGLDNPYEKRKMREQLAAARAGGKVSTGTADTNADYGDSATFFKRMQVEAKESIHEKKSGQDSTKEEASSKKNRSSKLML